MAEPSPEQPAQSMTWTVWPAAQRPAQAGGLAAMAVLLAVFCSMGFGGVLYGLAALVVVLAAAAPFLLPCTYALDGEGLHARGILWRKDRAWDRVGSYLRAPDFIAVSSDAEPTHRSISDGMILRLSGNGDEVEAMLARHIPKWETPGQP